MTEQSDVSKKLCKNVCGFYGSDSNEGYCSVCYKEHLKKKNNENVVAAASVTAASSSKLAMQCVTDTPSTSLQLSPSEIDDSSVSSPGQSCSLVEKQVQSSESISFDSSCTESIHNTSNETHQNSEKQRKGNRCFVCKKKLGLTGFDCRCGGLFCSLHRYSDKHNCTFDYKEHGQQQIRKNNPVVTGEKISKI